MESPLISPTLASTPESITNCVGSNVPAYFHLSPTRHTGTSGGDDAVFSASIGSKTWSSLGLCW